jgi:hypothetical protein
MLTLHEESSLNKEGKWLKKANIVYRLIEFTLSKPTNINPLTHVPEKVLEYI